MKKGDLHTKEFTITNQVYEGFINVFHDRNPLHVDPNFACSKGFDGEVMHGNILAGFISFFIGECLPIKNVIIHSQEIQYKRPVYLNQELLLQAEVIDVFASVNVVELKYHFRLKTDLQVVAKGKIQLGII